MAIRQYIGARYVPRFRGLYDSTTIYDALDVVDNGQGTSYIARVTVPANTPLNDTNYWFVYGASSGAILSLQNRMDAAEVAIADTPKKRRYVLIGDSFGCGIIGGGQPWTTGWINYFDNLFPGDVFFYDPSGDQSFEGVSSFTSTSQKNFIGQLEYVHANKLGSVPAETITDVIVLGGTNEDATQTIASIALAIDTFCARSKALFPNANIAIGIVGLEGRTMVYEKYTYRGYREGAHRNGAKFLIDCINLGTLRTYDSGAGHWTASGYALYNPYIAEMIIKGSTDYFFEETVNTLTFTNDVQTPYGTTFTPALLVGIDSKNIVFTLYATNTYSAPNVLTTTKIAGGSATRSGTMIRFNQSKLNYVYKFNQNIWSGKYLYTNDNSGSVDPTIGGDCEFRIGYDSTLQDFVISYMAATPIKTINNFTYSLLLPNKVSPSIYSFRI